MALSYGLSLNVYVVFSVQSWRLLENLITSVERIEQYMHIPGEAAEVIESQRPMHNWPVVGKVKICDLKVNRKNQRSITLYIKKFLNYGMYLLLFCINQVRYRPNAPLVL